MVDGREARRGQAKPSASRRAPSRVPPRPARAPERFRYNFVAEPLLDGRGADGQTCARLERSSFGFRTSSNSEITREAYIRSVGNPRVDCLHRAACRLQQRLGRFCGRRCRRRSWVARDRRQRRQNGRRGDVIGRLRRLGEPGRHWRHLRGGRRARRRRNVTRRLDERWQRWGRRCRKHWKCWRGRKHG
jgi:hypothetical protein